MSTHTAKILSFPAGIGRISESHIAALAELAKFGAIALEQYLTDGAGIAMEYPDPKDLEREVATARSLLKTGKKAIETVGQILDTIEAARAAASAPEVKPS